MKKTLPAVSALLLFLASGCGETVTEAPKITVTSSGVELPSLAGAFSPADGQEDSTGILGRLMADNSFDSVPVIALGNEIMITLDGPSPDSAELTDTVITTDGTPKYIRVSADVPVTFSGDVALFRLEVNPAAALSSQSADYAPGATLRGFRLICRWGDNVCEYAFVLRSDATGYTMHWTITAAEAYAMMLEREDCIVLDVRTETEFAEGHIEGAILIPDTEVAQRAYSELPDKNAVILVYCRSGRRSALAAKTLADMGYASVFDFGGIIDWPYGDLIKP